MMFVGLKNASVTYQIMMNMISKGDIGEMLEIYIDDMIV